MPAATYLRSHRVHLTQRVEWFRVKVCFMRRLYLPWPACAQPEVMAHGASLTLQQLAAVVVGSLVPLVAHALQARFYPSTAVAHSA